MRVLPASRQDWLQFLLFPLRTYVLITPVCLYAWSRLPGVLSVITPAVGYIEAAYALCVPIFVGAGLVQLATHHRRSAHVSFAFAVGASVTLFFLLPVCAARK
jgi:hypothetical protein